VTFNNKIKFSGFLRKKKEIKNNVEVASPISMVVFIGLLA